MFFTTLNPNFEAFLADAKQQALALGDQELEFCFDPAVSEKKCSKIEKYYGKLEDVRTPQDVRCFASGIAEYAFHKFEKIIISNEMYSDWEKTVGINGQIDFMGVCSPYKTKLTKIIAERLNIDLTLEDAESKRKSYQNYLAMISEQKTSVKPSDSFAVNEVQETISIIDSNPLNKSYSSDDSDCSSQSTH